MPTPVPKESYIQVLNLADSDVEVTIGEYDLFRQPIKPFQVIWGIICLFSLYPSNIQYKYFFVYFKRQSHSIILRGSSILVLLGLSQFSI